MQKYICKNCGAELYWDADEGKLKCEYCNHTYSPSDYKDETVSENEEEPIEVKSEEVDKSFTSTAQDISADMVVYKCNHCSGEVIADKQTVATVCPYCGRALSITSKLVGEFRPEVVLPFKVSKEKATELYTQYVSKSKLTPKEFRNNRVIEKIQGLYVPYYLTSTFEQGNVVYECERTTSRRSGYDRITRHDVFHVKISGNAQFNSVPSDASNKLDDKFMDTVEPFNFRGLQNFNPGFMAGFIADRADTDKRSVVNRSLKKIKDSFLTLFNRYIGVWSRQTLISYQDNPQNIQVKYAMLPIWIFTEEYEGKLFTFAVNGDTGKVVGKLPLSKAILVGKSSLCGLVGVGVVLLLALINSL